MNIYPDSAHHEDDTVYREIFDSLDVPVIRCRVQAEKPSAANRRSGRRSSASGRASGVEILEANRSALQLLGVESPETGASPGQPVLSPESGSAFLSAVAELRRGSRRVERELEFTVIPEKHVLTRAVITLLGNRGGELHLTARLTPLAERVSPVSGQTETLRTMVENIHRVKCVFDGSNYGMWDWDIARSETFFVRHWAEILGYGPDEIAQNRNLWEESIHPEDEPRASRALRDHLDGVTPYYETIHRMRAKSGEWRWILDRGRIVERDSEGKPLRAVGINVDLTEYKRMETALLESETRYRAIFDAVQDSIFVKDRDLQYTLVNQAMERLFRIPASEMIGATDRELLGEEASGKNLETDLRVLSGEIVYEEIVEPVDDVLRILHIIKTPMRDSSGAITGICGVARDSTERRQSDYELLDRSHFLQLLIDTIPNPLYYKDVEGKYLGCNRAFEEFMGLSREEMVGKSVEEVYAPEMAKVYGMMDHTLLESPGVQTYETQIRDASGTIHSVIINKATYRNINGSLGGIVGIIVDITKRKEIEHELIASEKRYRGLIESQSDLVIRIDPNGLFTYANDAYCLKFGKSRKQLIGKPFMHIIHEEDLPSSLQAMRNLDKPPYRVSIEQRALTVEGWRWIAWEDYALKDETGHTTEVQKVGRDITNYKLMQEDLLHEIEFIKLISSVSSRFINLAAGDIGGVIASSLERIGLFTGFDRIDVYPLTPNGMMSSFTWKAKESKLPEESRFEVLLKAVPGWMERSRGYESIHCSGLHTLSGGMRSGKDLLGSLGVQSLIAVPLVYNKSLHGFLSLISMRRDRKWREEDVALLSTVADIFVNALAHQRTEAELEQSKKELQRSERLIATGRLAASIAHEINNPLQAMTANISYLAKVLPADFPQSQVLDQLKMGVLRIRNTVRQLLDIHRAKSESGETVLINDVIDSTLGLLENQLVINRVAVEKSLAENLPPIRGIAQELFQVFLNIILNAMDAMPDGGILFLRTGLVEEEVRISITDTGYGISEKTMEHIFDPFFTTKSKMLGTGLGLSIVKGIVESFGGRIAVASAPGKGATFTVTFPVSS